MDFFTAGIDPLYAIGSNINISKVRSKDDAKREFASVFVSQILKEVLKNQSSMFGEEGSLGMYSHNLYNDIFIAKVANDIAYSSSFGFDKIFADRPALNRTMK